ncbi:protein-L-isoaspartate O-methyltransferase [Halobacteriovorax sp. XZX-3]|uniref:protein-L-isoaspartate O-methyltransferase family protein n=1 Tax=unclassified Halobacteriovorax TaxID=2639665 RepID=UPI0037122F47
MNELIKNHQDRFIAQNTGLSEEVIDAYYRIPRHLFISKFKDYPDNWVDLDDDNLERYLPLLYADHPLAIFGNQEVVSTISQPSFVLTILDLLNLEPGQKVFELGCGSGWNAALMGHIVGREGKVISVEIIPELVKTARISLDKMGIKNVKVIEGDGTKGFLEDAPYDKAIFTAGAYDLPSVFHKQLRDDATLVFVLKGSLEADVLYVLKKDDVEGCFISTKAIACSFVPVITSSKHKVSEFNLSMALNHTLKIYPNIKEVDVPCHHMMKQHDSLFVWV